MQIEKIVFQKSAEALLEMATDYFDLAEIEQNLVG
jgi:hypothetical protein